MIFKSYFDEYLYDFFSNLKLTISIIATFGGSTLLFISKVNIDLTAIFGAVFTISGLILLVADLIEKNYDRNKRYAFIVKNSHGNIHFPQTYSNWETKAINGTLVACSREVDDLIEKTDLILVKKSNPYLIQLFLKEIAHPMLSHRRKEGARIWNDKKIRICNDFFCDNTMHVIVQETNYFNGLLTNDLGNLLIKDRKLNRHIDIATLYMDNDKLLPLSISKCSNHFGVSTIAIDENNSLYIQINSRYNAQSSNLYVPSGMGSANYEDLQNVDNLRDLVCKVAERELIEEMQLKKSNSSKDSRIKMSTNVLGFVRNINRGGKPEFFCYTKIPKELSCNIEPLFGFQIISEYLGNTLIEQIDKIDELIANYEKCSSWVLIYNLMLLKRKLQEEMI